MSVAYMWNAFDEFCILPFRAASPRSISAKCSPFGAISNCFPRRNTRAPRISVLTIYIYIGIFSRARLLLSHLLANRSKMLRHAITTSYVQLYLISPRTFFKQLHG